MRRHVEVEEAERERQAALQSASHLEIEAAARAQQLAMQEAEKNRQRVYPLNPASTPKNGSGSRQ